MLVHAVTIGLEDSYNEAMKKAESLGGSMVLVEEVYERMSDPNKYVNELEYRLVTKKEYNQGYESIYWGSLSPSKYREQYPDRIDANSAYEYEKQGMLFAIFDDGSKDYDDKVYEAVQYYNEAKNNLAPAITAIDSDIETIITQMEVYRDQALAFGDEFGNGLDRIADNTEKTAEELTYLRDLAEREAINRFTTAEVKIDMSGMNNRIDSEADFDGFIGLLSNGLAEALAVAAERAEVR